MSESDTDSNLTKNEIAWLALEKKYSLLSQIDETGIASLTSTQIKEFRETRLLTKIGERTSLPSFLGNNGLSLLPVSRSKFVIGRFEAFQDLPSFSAVPITKILNSELLSLRLRASSEATSLLAAFDTGIISDFLEDEPIKLSIMGRMGSGDFSFKVNGYPETLGVKGSQIEIDAGFESPGSITLVEAKSTEVSSFLVRQLYYPYRTWTNKIRLQKQIRSVFVSIVNDKFQIIEYGFEDLNNYSSIFEIKKACYQLQDSLVGTDVVRDSLALPTLGISKVVPYPQADSIDRIVSLLISVFENEGTISKQDVASIQIFHERQADYYLNASIYLGFLNSPTEELAGFTLTSAGDNLVESGPEARTKIIVERLLRDPVLRELFENITDLTVEALDSRSKEIVINAISRMMKEGEIVNLLADTTVDRRAQTMMAWAKWVIEHVSA